MKKKKRIKKLERKILELQLELGLLLLDKKQPTITQKELDELYTPDVIEEMNKQ